MTCEVLNLQIWEGSGDHSDDLFEAFDARGLPNETFVLNVILGYQLVHYGHIPFIDGLFKETANDGFVFR